MYFLIQVYVLISEKYGHAGKGEWVPGNKHKTQKCILECVKMMHFPLCPGKINVLGADSEIRDDRLLLTSQSLNSELLV